MALNMQPYTSQILAGGTDTAQATPMDMGAGIGQGLDNVGRGLGQVADAANEVDQDQGRIWAATAVSQKELQLRQGFQSHVDSLDPTSADYPAQVKGLADNANTAMADAQSDLMAQAPSSSARRFVGEHMAFANLRMADTAVQTQAALNANYTTGLVQQGVKADTDLIAASPDNDTVARLLQKQHDTIVNLGTINPDTKLRLLQGVQHQYSVAQATSVMSANPSAFLASLNLNGGVTTRGHTVGGVATQAPGDGSTGSAGVQNFNADTVKPYSPAQIQSITDKVNAPSQYDGLFQQAATQNGLDWKDLKMRSVAESGLNPSASSGQASGIMQLSPGTAAALGVDANDPAQAIPAAAGLLAKYKAGGAQNADLAYYGGADKTQWGPNTQQYAANLAAVRGAMGQPAEQDPQVQPLSEQDIAKAAPPMMGWANLAFGEKVQLTRQAESLVGKSLAASRGQGAVQMQDALASLNAGQDYPNLAGLKAQNAQTLNAPEAQRRNDMLDTAQQFGGFKAQVTNMPVAQAQAWLDQYKPQGGDDFAFKQPMYLQAQAALASAQREVQADPQAYAIANKIGGAQPLDFSSPQALGQGLRQRVAVNATMSRDYGAQPSIFSDSEVTQLDQGVAKLAAPDAIQYLQSVRQSLGNSADFATGMRQIAAKSPGLAYAANVAASNAKVEINGVPVASSDIAATILDGDRILNARALVTGKNSGAVATMPSGSSAVHFDEKNFQLFFNQQLSGAFMSPDAQTGAAQQKDVYNAAKDYYVAKSYQQGKPLDVADPQLVNQSIQAVTGGSVRMNSGNLLLPYGMPLAEFQGQWSTRARSAIQAAGYSSDDTDHLMRNTVAINLGDGKYGFQNGTHIQTGRNGRPIVVDYGQAYTPPPPTPPPQLGEALVQQQQSMQGSIR